MQKAQSFLLSLLVLVGGIAAADEAKAQGPAAPKLNLWAKTSATFVTANLSDSSKSSGVSLGGNDCFGAEYSGDRAGVKISVKGSLANPGTLVLDDYYGWYQLGFVKFTAGETEMRYADRVIKDASSWVTFEKYKYGPLAYSASAKQVSLIRESDNVASWTVAEVAATAKFDAFQLDVVTGSDNATVGATSVTYPAYSAFEQFAVRAAYRLQDAADISASFQRYSSSDATAAVYASVLAVKDLCATVGYSGYLNITDASKNVHAAELRARYAVGSLSLTTHNNLSLGSAMVLYDMANATYKIDDTFAPSVYAMNMYASAISSDTLTFRPGVTVTVMKGASIDAGIEAAFTMTSSSTTPVVSVPVVFRIKI